MAQYRDDFSGNSPIGGAPLGWTKRWNTGNMTAVTVADAAAEGGVVMRIDVTSNSHTSISMDAVDAESPDTREDAEVLFKFKSADVSDFSGYGISPLLRGSGAAGGEYSYRTYIVDNDGEMRVGKYVAGSSIDIATQQDLNAHIDVSANEWLWFRMRINGTTLSVKCWQDEETQPGAQHRYEPPYWQWSDTDASVSGAGWIGITLFDTGLGPWDIAYVGVGTNGDIAPYPGGTDLETLEMTQQTIQAAVQMEPAEIRITQQMMQTLVQLNTPAVSGTKRRNTIIGM